MAWKAEVMSFPKLPMHKKSILNAHLTDGHSQEIFIKMLVEASMFSFLLTLFNVAAPDTLYRRGKVQQSDPKLALGGLTVRSVSVVITWFLKSSSPCPLSVPQPRVILTWMIWNSI